MPETPTSETLVSQTLTGVQLAAPGQCRCQTCGIQLHDGYPVRVYAYQPADRDTWDVPRVYCRDCAPDEIATPTLGVTEALADAWLGALSLCADQTTRLVLTDVRIAAQSPPDEGSRP